MYNKATLRRLGRLLFVGLIVVSMSLSLCACVDFDEILDSLMAKEAEDNAVHVPNEDKESSEDVSEVIPDTAEELFTVSDYNDGVSIDGYTGNDSYIKIPATIGGKTVLSIAGGAFKDRELADGATALTVTDIVVPDTVVNIGHSAFGACRSLESIVLPFIGGGSKSVNFGYVFGAKDAGGNQTAVPETLKNVVVGGTVVGDGAFKNCVNLLSIELLAAENIGNSAFEGCDRLQKIIIPDSVTAMGTSLFKGCDSLSDLRLPYVESGEGGMFIGSVFGGKSYKDNLTSVPRTLRNLTVNWGDSVDANAFYECNNLVSLTLIGDVKSIGENAFYRCKKLSFLTIKGGEDYKGIESLGKSAFSYCAALGDIVLSDQIREIPDYCFYTCSSLRNISVGGEDNVLPSGLTNIGTKAFTYCENLVNLVLPEGIEEIGDEMFSGCSYLSKINIPATVTKIGNKAFNGCGNLLTVDFAGNKVEKIGDYAFAFCTSLKDFTVPASVTDLGKYIFNGCYSLKTALVLARADYIPEGMFFGCSYLNSFDFGKGENVIPTGLSSLGDKAFYGCRRLDKVVLPGDISTLPAGIFADCNALEEISIPSSVTSIGAGAFKNCTDLLKVAFAKGSKLKDIEREAFEGCTRLKDIVLPAGVDTLGRLSFKDCAALSKLTLSNGITEIGDGAFENCTKLVFKVSTNSYAYNWLLKNGVGSTQLDIEE